jgi:uncharacterized protein YciI
LKTFTTKIVVAAGVVMLACAFPAFAQHEAQYDMGIMQMVFLSRSPDWKGEDRDRNRIEKEHRAHVERLISEGKLALAGEVPDEGVFLREIMVFRIDTLDEAKQIARALPAVREGLLKADAISWFTARNIIKAPQTPLMPETNYIFGLLVRGPKWTKEQTEETKKIQEGHMANINRLAKTGKLVLAGPFEGNDDRRGVFIFKVNTTAEAQALTDTDPAVIAGRLQIKLYRWSVAKGMLP